MESSINQPFFFEFYGLPGCGKSTVSHLLADLLRENSVIVSEPSYVLDHRVSHPLRAFKKLSLYFKMALINHKLFKRVNAIVVKNGYAGIGRVMQTANVLLKLDEYRKPQAAQFVIWDQGLIQAAISLSITEKHKAASIFDELSQFLPESVRMIRVLLSADSKEALMRIKMRSSNDSRIEKINEEEREGMMNKFDVAIRSIKNVTYSMLDEVIIPGNVELDEMVVQIYGVCDRYLK